MWGGFSQQQEYGRYTFSCAAWEHRRSMRFFVLFSCPHIMTELSCHLQLHPSTSPDPPPVGPTALRSPGPHHDGVENSKVLPRVHDFSAAAAAAAMAAAAAAAAAGSHRRLHLHSSRMLITYVLLCRPYRRYGHMVNLKPRSFGPARLIFTLVHPLAAHFGNSTRSASAWSAPRPSL